MNGISGAKVDRFRQPGCERVNSIQQALRNRYEVPHTIAYVVQKLAADCGSLIRFDDSLTVFAINHTCHFSDGPSAGIETARARNKLPHFVSVGFAKITFCDIRRVEVQVQERSSSKIRP